MECHNVTWSREGERWSKREKAGKERIWEQKIQIYKNKNHVCCSCRQATQFSEEAYSIEERGEKRLCRMTTLIRREEKKKKRQKEKKETEEKLSWLSERARICGKWKYSSACQEIRGKKYFEIWDISWDARETNESNERWGKWRRWERWEEGGVGTEGGSTGKPTTFIRSILTGKSRL